MSPELFRDLLRDTALTFARLADEHGATTDDERWAELADAARDFAHALVEPRIQRVRAALVPAALSALVPASRAPALPARPRPSPLEHPETPSATASLVPRPRRSRSRRA
jgi:hypothetical protein